MAERVTALAERLGSRQVAAHHGSLAELRLDAERASRPGN